MSDVYIIASCPACRTVTLKRDKVKLVTYKPPDQDLSYYEFTCPLCDGLVKRGATPEIIQILNKVGVQTSYCDLANSTQPDRIGVDDMERFVRQLNELPPDEIMFHLYED